MRGSAAPGDCGGAEVAVEGGDDCRFTNEQRGPAGRAGPAADATAVQLPAPTQNPHGGGAGAGRPSGCSRPRRPPARRRVRAPGGGLAGWAGGGWWGRPRGGSCVSSASVCVFVCVHVYVACACVCCVASECCGCEGGVCVCMRCVLSRCFECVVGFLLIDTRIPGADSLTSNSFQPWFNL